MVVYFYSKIDAYGAFSNFAPHGVEMDGQWWPTVEHYFQAQKFHDDAYREKIRTCGPPKNAKSLGQSRKHPLRPDWEDVKAEIMYRAVLKKFETHEEPRALLLSTGDEEIMEASPNDYYWGAGKDGSGLNMLGKLLMQVREELRQVGQM